MSQSTWNETDLLVQWSRRGIYFALAIIVLLGCVAIASTAFPASRAADFAQQLMTVLPVFIVVAVAGLGVMAKGMNRSPSSPAMTALRTDELRQASLNQAYRSGFWTVLVAQPLLALLLSWWVVAQPVALMSGISLLAGLIALLARFLWLDR